MIVLGLDTATMWQSVALVDEHGALIAEDGFDAHRRTSELLVIVDRLCRGAGVAPAAIDAVAVGAGPGSFTGLRIGLATAKGIAFAVARPLWIVSSLAALAAASGERAVCAVIDARKGEVFAGVYVDGALVGEERVLAPEGLALWADALAPELRYAGNAIDSYAAVLGPLAGRWVAAPRTPPGVTVARLALAGAREDVLLAGAPTYIRPSEAEVMYPDGIPGALRVLRES